MREPKTKDGSCQSQNTGNEKRGSDRIPEGAVFFGAEKLCGQDSCASRKTDIKHDKNAQNRACGTADCREGFFSCDPPHDQGIDRVVELLEKGTEQKRKKEKEDLFPDYPFRNGVHRTSPGIRRRIGIRCRCLRSRRRIGIRCRYLQGRRRTGVSCRYLRGSCHAGFCGDSRGVFCGGCLQNRRRVFICSGIGRYRFRHVPSVIGNRLLSTGDYHKSSGRQCQFSFFWSTGSAFLVYGIFRFFWSTGSSAFSGLREEFFLVFEKGIFFGLGN